MKTRHCCPMIPAVAPFAAMIALLAAVAPTSASETRGTWLTTTGPDHIRSGFNTQNIVDNLDGVGLNTVYVEAWKNGYTNYDSQVLTDLIGVDTNPSVLGSRDLLDETSATAHRRGLIHVAWFEYGFASSSSARPPARSPITP